MKKISIKIALILALMTSTNSELSALPYYSCHSHLFTDHCHYHSSGHTDLSSAEIGLIVGLLGIAVVGLTFAIIAANNTPVLENPTPTEIPRDISLQPRFLESDDDKFRFGIKW